MDFNASDFAQIMTRDRFDQLWSNSHFVNNSNAHKRGADNFDKIFKVRWLIDKISVLFRSVFQPA